MACFTQSESPMCLANAILQPGCERSHHLVIGSPEGMRATINLLHMLTHTKQATWSQLIAIL